MKIVYGIYQDDFYAPLWMFGIMKDVNYDGTYMWCMICFKWYFGIAFPCRDNMDLWCIFFLTNHVEYVENKQNSKQFNKLKVGVYERAKNYYSWDRITDEYLKLSIKSILWKYI